MRRERTEDARRAEPGINNIKDASPGRRGNAQIIMVTYAVIIVLIIHIISAGISLQSGLYVEKSILQMARCLQRQLQTAAALKKGFTPITIYSAMLQEGLQTA